MQSRRSLFRAIAAGVAALAVVAGSVIADELVGKLKSVDVEGKKIVVVEKDTDKEIEVQVSSDTDVVSKKGTSKLDLEKLAKGVEKAKSKGGYDVVVTHEKNVASKIEIKKAAPKKDDSAPKKDQ